MYKPTKLFMLLLSPNSSLSSNMPTNVSHRTIAIATLHNVQKKTTTTRSSLLVLYSDMDEVIWFAVYSWILIY